VRDLGLPEELQIRDTRSGGITEAKTLVDPYTLQHAAQHTQGTTTDIYPALSKLQLVGLGQPSSCGNDHHKPSRQWGASLSGSLIGHSD
jgi:hypothetical protein